MAEGLCSMDETKEAVPDGEDRLSTLPEDVIRLLLSFLPSSEAVKTCVLGTRWRNLWKSLPSLRIDMGIHNSDSADFVNSLLRYRDRTPLHECEIFFFDYHDEYEFYPDAEQWLRYAVSCKVRVLHFEVSMGFPLPLSAGTLISQHLTRLSLQRVEFEDFTLDVLSCQSLEVLEIDLCENINIETDFPKSLRILRIRCTTFLPNDTRIFISAPGLVTLELADCYKCWTPVLKNLPALVTAFIRIGFYGMDSCQNSDRGDCGHESCVACYGVEDCVLLRGLLGATNLELLSHRSMIFRNEIKWCPMFSNLKTLLLGDWCINANFSGLVYFLQHSPLLEKFTLHLSKFNEESYIKTSEVYKPKEQFLVSKHLKAVEITYCEGDECVHQVLNVLAYHGVHSELIKTEMKCYPIYMGNACFSFECK